MAVRTVRYYLQGRLVAGSPEEAVRLLRERYGYVDNNDGEDGAGFRNLALEKAWQMDDWYEWTAEVVEPEGDCEGHK